MSPDKALMAWSGGKDSAWALELARRNSGLEIMGAMVTITEGDDRVLLHGVREELLQAQLQAVGLPMIRLSIPRDCPGAEHDAALYRLLMQVKAEGVTRVIYGDLFREDVRGYREAQLSHMGLTGVWPLWSRNTRELVKEMIDGGLRTYISCVDSTKLPRAFAGRELRRELIDQFPAEVDPCGENGEFHSFVFDGPMFGRPVSVVPAGTFDRDGFAFCDFRLVEGRKAA